MNILEYFNSLEETYPSIYYELNQELSKLRPESFFDYTKNLTDPFQAITTNPDTDKSILNHLYEWYQSINPNYKPLNTLDPHIPKFRGIQPYRTLLLNMAKDLIILQHTKQFPKPNIPQITNNNKDKTNNNTLKKYNKHNEKYRATLFYPIKNNSKKMLQYIQGTNNSRNLHTLPSDNFDEIKRIINSILILLNDILTIDNPLHYKYLSIILIIDKYLQLFSFGNKTYDNFQTQLFKYNEIPFLIYPTFNPISYTKVIYFMQAPVLNFMMMNTRKVVHSYYEFPYHQVYHDLLNHANKTHQIYQVRDKITDLDTISRVKETFKKNNIMINRLKKYINYDIKLFSVSPHPAPALTNNNTDHTDHNDNINKFILCYALFFMCHEIGTYDFSSIDTIIKKNITNINKYDFIMLADLNESLPSSKYNMEEVISMIGENSFEKQVISQLQLLNTQHKGGKKTNTHHKKTKKKSNRKKLNKLTITNLLKKTHIK